jgi:hypothetical protein
MWLILWLTGGGQAPLPTTPHARRCAGPRVRAGSSLIKVRVEQA